MEKDPSQFRDFETLCFLGAFRSGPSRERLLRHSLDWDHDCNLYHHTDGSWDPEYAEETAQCILRSVVKSKRDWTIVVCGSRACEAFGIDDTLPRFGAFYALDDIQMPGELLRFRRQGMDPPKKMFRPRVIALAAPHPSGLSRWWNDESNVALIEHQFKRLRRLS